MCDGWTIVLFVLGNASISATYLLLELTIISTIDVTDPFVKFAIGEHQHQLERDELILEQFRRRLSHGAQRAQAVVQPELDEDDLVELQVLPNGQVLRRVNGVEVLAAARRAEPHRFRASFDGGDPPLVSRIGIILHSDLLQLYPIETVSDTIGMKSAPAAIATNS